MKELLERLFNSWMSPGKLDKSLFSDKFIYHGGSDVHTTEVWINSDNGEMPISDAEIVELIVDGAEVGSVVFEFTDPVTLLKHKTTWVVKASNGLISELIETDLKKRGARERV